MFATVVARQIILTLAYTQQFQFPLTEEEIWQRLIAAQNISQPFSRADLIQALRWLKEHDLVDENAGYFYLLGQEKILQIRQKRFHASTQKRAELLPLQRMCRWMPWIAGVAVTGSLAMNNADTKADADVMIVTENNRLWLVRPLLVLFSFLYGKRRSWNREEENSWCLNLWLERQSLQVDPRARSIYTAYEVVQADWLFSKNGVANEFYLANRWVEQYLPNWSSMSVVDSVAMPSLAIFSPVFTILNNLAYTIQLWYMKPHMTKERVSLSAAFFHPRDTRHWITESWKSIIKNI